MSDAMAALLTYGYMLPAGIMFVMALYLLDDPGPEPAAERRRGARLLITAPIWPLVVIWHIPRHVRALFELADFGGKR